MNDTGSFSQVSVKLLFAIKTKADTEHFQNQLKNSSQSDLLAKLITEEIKKAFWINIYNSYFHIIRNLGDVPMKEVYSRKTIKYPVKN